MRIIVTGKVQGVFFRAHAQDSAVKTGIKGWIRNLENGSVEIVAQGERENMEKFVNWCRRGPDSARVENVSAAKEHVAEKFTDFSVRD